MNFTIASHTLGCKVNQADTDYIINLALNFGFEVLDFENKADVYLINSCLVTHTAEHKTRQFIAKAKKNNPASLILVAGCYAKLKKEELEKHAFLVIDNYQELELAFKKTRDFLLKNNTNHLNLAKNKEINLKEKTVRIRKFLAIQNGCDQFCSYCIIPYARGCPKSKPIQEIITEIKKMPDYIKEIVLTGINIGKYGIDLTAKVSLFDLIQEILKLKKFLRIRISSIEPQCISIELLELIKSEKKIGKHLHIPLQSGSEKILKLMNRPYSKDDYFKLVSKIKDLIPEINLTTDLIVGFPNENDSEFLETVKFIKNIAFSKIHLFKYSKRPNTLASKMIGQVSNNTIKERLAILKDLNKSFMTQYLNSIKRLKREVLWEAYNNKTKELIGLSDNYLRIKIKSKKEKIGLIEKISLQDVKKLD